METAVVTGATSGIGKAICEMLLEENYTVYGIGRDFSKVDLQGDFRPIVCDLSNSASIEPCLRPLKGMSLSLLVNSAGFGRFDPLEQMRALEIKRLVDVNLIAPMTITKLLLEQIKLSQGTIINISSIEAVRSSRFSSVYSATKAGLRSFGLALFEEVRTFGIKVVTLNLDMTQTPFFDTLRFEPHSDENASLRPQTVSQAVQDILALPKSSVVTEMTLRPQIVKIEKKSTKKKP